ncbi:SAM hydroxide adenosyltransferase [Micromonospora salmantinae]|uniref:SAM hydroxide adenosyltransferase n=1 Tax=Micromonospora salmantinae TaxID=2911211 RepID=UPI0035574C69
MPSSSLPQPALRATATSRIPTAGRFRVVTRAVCPTSSGGGRGRSATALSRIRQHAPVPLACGHVRSALDLADHRLRPHRRLRRTFGDAPAGGLVAYVDSAGLVAVAVNGGRDADLLAARPGDLLRVSG